MHKKIGKPGRGMWRRAMPPHAPSLRKMRAGQGAEQGVHEEWSKNGFTCHDKENRRLDCLHCSGAVLWFRDVELIGHAANIMAAAT